jgi:hypothetical protein
MRKALLAIIVAAAVFPAAARSDGPPPGQVANQICAALRQQLGATFASKYASLDACVQQLTPAAQSIVNDCTSKAQPGTDAFRQCVVDGISAAVQQAGGTGGGVTAAPSAPEVAEDPCNDLSAALGTTFPSHFGTPEPCAQQLASTAQAVIAGCVTKAQPGTSDFSGCMHDGVDTAVAGQLALVDTAAGQSLAKQMCTTLQKKLGARGLARLFRTVARCRSQLQGVATTLAAGCRSKGTPGGSAYAHCVQHGVEAAVRKNGRK